MPTVTVTSPDGRTERVPLPKGASRDMIERTIAETKARLAAPSPEAQAAMSASELGAPAGPVAGAGGLAREVGGNIAQAAADPATLASTVAPTVVPGGALVKGAVAGTAGALGRAGQTLVQEGRLPTMGEAATEFAFGALPEAIARPLFAPDEIGRVVMNLDKAVGRGSLRQGPGVARRFAGVAVKDEIPQILKSITADVEKRYGGVRTAADGLGLVSANPQAISDAVQTTVDEIALLGQTEPTRAAQASRILSDIQQQVASGTPLTFRQLSTFRNQLGDVLPEYMRGRKRVETSVGRLHETMKADMLSQISGTPLEGEFKAAEKFFQHEAIPQRVAALSIANDKVTPDAVAQFILQKPNRTRLLLERASPTAVHKVRTAVIDDILERSTTPAGILQPAEAFAAFRKLDPEIRTSKLLEGHTGIGRVLRQLEKVKTRASAQTPLVRGMQQAAVLAVPGMIIGNQFLINGSATLPTVIGGLLGSAAGVKVLGEVLSNQAAQKLMQRGLAQRPTSQLGTRLLVQAINRAGFETVFGTPAAGALPAEQVEPSLL